MSKVLIIFTSIIILFTIPLKVVAQTNIDSLIAKTRSNVPDSVRAQAYIDICWELKASNPEMALEYGHKGLDVSRKLNDKAREASSLKNIGTIHLFLGDFQKAESYYKAAVKIFAIIKNDKGLAGSYNNLGLVKEQQGDFEKAMDYYQQSLVINERIGNKTGIASSLTNIGNILQMQGIYHSAIEYYLRALKIKEELNEKLGIADAYNNIGALYEKQNAYDQAIKNYQRALILYIEIDEKRKSGTVLHNLGYIQSLEKNYDAAMDFYQKSLEIRREYGDKQGIASTLMNIGNVYFEKGKNNEAQKYYDSSQTIYKEIGNKYKLLQLGIAVAELYIKQNQYLNAISLLEPIVKQEKLMPEELKQAYQILSQAYSKINNYHIAYNYQDLYVALKDSIGKEQNTKNIVQLQLDYEYQKKQKELEIDKEKQKLHDNAELEKRRMIIFLLIIGLFAFIFLAIIIYRNYLIKKRDNVVLETQKNEIEEFNEKLLLYQEELLSQKEDLEVQKKMVVSQRDLLEEKNQRINESIHYAKRIQVLLLPLEQAFQSTFKDYFILYKPKDIVSGDFYWLKETDSHILIAVADCTGHGVPGAFMSLLSITFLDEIISSGIINTAEILDLMREKIKRTLHSESNINEPRDGLDLGICSIDKKNRKLQYSGAYHSLLILSEDKNQSQELIEIHGDKMPIGTNLRNEKSFSSHIHSIQDTDRFFLYTDGFIDQFGGAYDRKFLPKKFKDILIQSKEKDLKIQKNELIRNLENWMDGREQIDDILVIGFKY